MVAIGIVVVVGCDCVLVMWWPVVGGAQECWVEKERETEGERGRIKNEKKNLNEVVKKNISFDVKCIVK